MFRKKKKMVLRAPAKINLFLEVLGVRKNGYHDIRSIIVPVSLYDEVTLEKSDDGIKTKTVVGKDLMVDDGREFLLSSANLATKAAELLKEKTGYKGGAMIRLVKNIPIGGGMGGGSSDAAAVLMGLNVLWETGLARKQLLRIGARIGCDVPVFMAGGPAEVGGLGEKIKPVRLEWDRNGAGWWIVLANPGFCVSTADIYSRYRETLTSIGKRLTNTRFALKVLDLELAAESLYNSLEPTVFAKYPLIRILAKLLKEAGAAGVLVSGSGASVFGLARDRKHAESVSTRLKASAGFPLWSKVARILPDGVMAAHGPLEARV